MFTKPTAADGGLKMSIFKKKKAAIPPECQGMEIKITSSTCTGEKVIGFYDRKTRELKYSELVKSDDDIKKFYEKYGIKQTNE